MSKIEGAKLLQRSAIKFTGEDLTNLRISDNVVRWLPKGGKTDPAHVLKLAKSIRQHGQTNHVTVRECEEREGDELVTYFEVIAGRHRTEAVKLIVAEPDRFELSDKDGAAYPLLATLVKADDSRAMTYSLNDNEGLQVGAMDYFKTANRHAQLFRLNQTEIADVMNKSQAFIGKILLLGRLTSYLQLALHEGRLKNNLCFSLVTAGMYSGAEIQEFSDRMESEKMSVQELKGEVNAKKMALRVKKAQKDDKVLAQKRPIAELFGRLRQMGGARALVFIKFSEGDPAVSEELFDAVFDDDPLAFKQVVEREDAGREAQSQAEEATAEEGEQIVDEDHGEDSKDPDGNIEVSAISPQELQEIQAQDYGQDSDLL